MCSLYNPGGMERVLTNKVNWLCAHTDYQILVITTDQKGRPPFYPLPPGVRTADLGINYSDDNRKPTFLKIIGYLLRRRRHKRALTSLLMKERPDIVVSLFPSESSFLPDIKDGSHKILEHHFCKLFRLQYGRRGLLGRIDRVRTRRDERLVRRFHRFVVLSRQDRALWGGMPNIRVIPNAVPLRGEEFSPCCAKRVIAVGRLDHQKGFDRLISAWTLVQADGRFPDWRLDIYGQGEWRDMLQSMIGEAHLSDSVRLNPPTRAIEREYLNSSILVMSSRYEGFPMVMLEAMATGLPAVAFDFQCGARDIIESGVNGLLVRDGDTVGLARALMALMADEPMRRRMGAAAHNTALTYSPDLIMGKWLDLFRSITEQE